MDGNRITCRNPNGSDVCIFIEGYMIRRICGVVGDYCVCRFSLNYIYRVNLAPNPPHMIYYGHTPEYNIINVVFSLPDISKYQFVG